MPFTEYNRENRISFSSKVIRPADCRLFQFLPGCGRLWLWCHCCGAGRPRKSTAMKTSSPKSHQLTHLYWLTHSESHSMKNSSTFDGSRYIYQLPAHQNTIHTYVHARKFSKIFVADIASFHSNYLLHSALRFANRLQFNIIRLSSHEVYWKKTVHRKC